jgi:hypothetical protein
MVGVIQSIDRHMSYRIGVNDYNRANPAAREAMVKTACDTVNGGIRHMIDDYWRGVNDAATPSHMGEWGDGNCQ